jgi:hypothetical protein
MIRLRYGGYFGSVVLTHPIAKSVRLLGYQEDWNTYNSHLPPELILNFAGLDGLGAVFADDLEQVCLWSGVFV